MAMQKIKIGLYSSGHTAGGGGGTTTTVQIPGYGIVVLTGSGNTTQLPGYGIVKDSA